MLRSGRRERLEARTTSMQRSSRYDRYRRQILEPALRLHEALCLGRQRTRIEVVHDKDHDGVAAFEFMQLGQQAEALFFVEFVEDLTDQPLGFGVFIMTPIGASRRPIRLADKLDDRVDRIEQAPGKV